MSKANNDLIRASQQLAMLATLLSKKIITEQQYQIVKDTIYRDYPAITGLIA